MTERFITVDGNEAAASVAYRTNEVIAIYPITPASPMGELSDAWSSAGRANVYGAVPSVIEMQSEGGAAGAVHGALQGGALTTTFTASQGLLLMIPNMFKIAGELSSAVIHVAARSIATHALSIFGDHSDVMAARSTGWAMLCASDVQEAHDFALISQAATLESRIPFLHFFDGFRTSHEVSKIEALSDDDIRALVDDARVTEHRARSLDPDRPVLRGSAQNPDVFFQAREAINPFYDALPGILKRTLERFRERTGRSYGLVDYVGHPQAERVIVLMGSGCGAVEETVRELGRRGERVGLVKVRLFRPFPAADLCAALPATVRSVAALDRTKEPGALGEPLYQDVVTALAEEWSAGAPPRVCGGRYGLSSKSFTPAMVLSIFAELERDAPKRHFTIGIVDDVTRLSLEWNRELSLESEDVTSAIFYGLGSDGTVGAAKSTIKIIGEGTDLEVQGYFVYDSKKAGSITVSHLRFGPQPIKSSYLIQRAGLVACHQFSFLERIDVLEHARQGATFLLATKHGPDEVWEHLPVEVQQTILTKGLRFFVVDGQGVAQSVGLGGRINTVMQVCFFALSGLFPREEAIERIKRSIESLYGKRGATVLERNFAAVDLAVESMHEVRVPKRVQGDGRRLPPVPAAAPDFVQRVTAMMIAGRGDLLPVSALPVDGTFPVGTARWEKRSIAREIPIWDSDICIQCALCSLVCPHAAIRMKVYPSAARTSVPAGFKAMPWKDKELPEHDLTIQVAPDDCTGCGICVEVCPAKSKEVARHKAIDMEPKEPHLEVERACFDAFLDLPEIDPRSVEVASVKGSQMLEPLFEFSGACAGCGETPYLKLLTQLLGDRLVVANATGCSSIFGGNLPTTPWTTNAEGRGPAWSNSLFEDNAEFGLGMRLAYEARGRRARAIMRELNRDLNRELDPELVNSLLERCARDPAAIHERREQVDQLRTVLGRLNCGNGQARVLDELSEGLVPRSVWIVGGDGWAYDIGFGGLDHVLASGHRVNVLVLDTGVYSNTGGQASKATPRAAVAKYASSGRSTRKKDLGMIAMAYGDVYVAQIAMGANPKQTIQALAEAEDYPGPSLVIAYSHCIAHGIEISGAMGHQKEATRTGFWPLFRFDPRRAESGENPFQLDCRKPSRPFRDFAGKEARFAMLKHSNPAGADALLARAQRDIDEQWLLYEQMADVERSVPDPESTPEEKSS